MQLLKDLFPIEDFNNWYASLSMADPYVQHTLFALGTLVLGLIGYISGQRLANYGKLCMVIGLILGGLLTFLFVSPYGYFAPGIGIVFLVTFLGSGLLAQLASHGNSAEDASK
jgi:hypothetical protein